MPAKPVFTPAQQALIKAAAERVFRTKFKWMKKTPDHPGGQEAMALALGVSQQTVSNLLKAGGMYNPGLKVATNIANLDGKTLRQLIGDYGADSTEEKNEAQNATAIAREKVIQAARAGYPNLDVCVSFYADRWQPWTIAAAKAGFFGPTDFAPPEWAGRLDSLEKALEKARVTMK